MKYYAVVELKMLDESWLASYIPEVTALVHKHGGRYLSRTNQVERIEGGREAPDVIVILEFPSREAIDGFYADPEYQPHLQNRLNGSKSELTLAAGEDMAVS